MRCATTRTNDSGVEGEEKEKDKYKDKEGKKEENSKNKDRKEYHKLE